MSYCILYFSITILLIIYFPQSYTYEYIRNQYIIAYSYLFIYLFYSVIALGINIFPIFLNLCDLKFTNSTDDDDTIILV